MKTFFVHAKSKVDGKLSQTALAQLPKRTFGLVSNIQHLHSLSDIQQQIPNSIIVGQVLGCRAENAERTDVDAFLYIGTGEFHPIKVALVTRKPVWCWNPVNRKLTQVSGETIQQYETRRKTALMKFYSAENVGVLISTKIGQNLNKIASYSKDIKMQRALELLQRNDRNYYLFTGDTFSPADLENFPFIDCWVNTACSRIADEKSNIVNVDEILAYEKKSAVAVAPAH